MTPTKYELNRFWKLFQYSISSDFVLAYFKNKELNSFHTYANKEIHKLQNRLEEEFRNKFVDGK